MNTQEESMYLLIADISGYTSFMLKTHTATMHAKILITELMESLIQKIELPFTISKLEGDAIFFYLLEKDLSPSLTPQILSEKILLFFEYFSKKLQELKVSNFCDCGACTHLDLLDLKMIIHYGKASIVNVGRFIELSGIDVITVHRLLKNSLKNHHYVLMTKAAYDKLKFLNYPCVHSSEKDKDLGVISTVILYPHSPSTQIKKSISLLQFVIFELKMFLKSWKVHFQKRNFNHFS